MIRTPRTEFRAPSVIRLQHHIRRPRPRVKLSPPRGLRPRPPHLPVLRPPVAHDLTLDHVVPRHRGGSHTWENLVTACKVCNHRKGGKTPRRGAHAAPPRRRSSRAATSTRCSRRTSPTSATRPGASYLFLGPELSRRPAEPGRVATIASARRSGRSHDPRPPVGGRPRRRTSSAARSATSSSAASRTTGTWRPTPGRTGSSSSSRAPSTRTASGRWRSARPASVHEITTFRHRPRRTPTSGGPHRRRVRRPHRATTSPGATSRSTRWPGAPTRPGTAPPRRRPSSTRSAGWPTSRRGSCARSATRGARFEEDALRMVRAVRLAATLDVRDRAGDARRDPGQRRARRPPLGRADLAAELDKLLGAERPSVGLRLMAETGPARRRLARSSPPSAGCPRTRSPARTSGITRCGRSMPRRSTGRSSGWPRCSTTSASRRRWPTGHFLRPRCGRAPSWRRSSSTGSGRRGRSPSGSSTSSATTCSRTTPAGATPASGASSSGSGRRRARDAASPCARPTTSAAAWRPTATSWTGCAGGSASSSSGDVVLDRGDLAIDGDDLIARARARPGPTLGRILDELLERGDRRPDAQRPADAPPPRPGDAHGGPMIELLLAAERMLDGRRPRPRRARSSPRSPRPTRGTRSRSWASREVALGAGDDAGGRRRGAAGPRDRPGERGRARMIDRLEEVPRYRRSTDRGRGRRRRSRDQAPTPPRPSEPEPEPEACSPAVRARALAARGAGAPAWLDRLLGFFRRR